MERNKVTDVSRMTLWRRKNPVRARESLRRQQKTYRKRHPLKTRMIIARSGLKKHLCKKCQHNIDKIIAETNI